MITKCERCRLSTTRTNIVNGCGSIKSGIMLIGEAPGEDEDRSGRPFVGKAGKFLDEMLPLAGVVRKSVYITNVVKCRPPKNRQPIEDEINKCIGHLAKEIVDINPSIIILLGQTACNGLRMNIKVGDWHGQRAKCNLLKKWVFVSYHPAAPLYNPQMIPTVEADFSVMSKSIIRQYPDDTNYGMTMLNLIYDFSNPSIVMDVNYAPGEYSFNDDKITAAIDAVISLQFYKYYKSASKLREFYHYLKCGYIHGNDNDNWSGAVIKRLEQTLTIYDAYTVHPDNQTLIKALYSRGIKSKEGAAKLYRRAGMKV